MAADSRRARRAGPILALSVALLVPLLALAACAAPGATVAPPSSAATVAPPTSTATTLPTVDPAAFPLTLTDDEGTEVMLQAEPERIVSLTPATTEILFAIGAGPRVVATTDFDDYPPEAVALPDVASFTSVDVEQIVGLETDLVIAGGNAFNPPEAIARLRSLGIPVVVTYADTVDAVLHDIRLVGLAAGESEAANRLADSMGAQFDAVRDAMTGVDRPVVFYELDATGKIYTAADGSFLEEMLQIAGAAPVTTGSETAFDIPLERLVEANPAIILLGDAAYGVTPEQVAARPGWDSIDAVVAGAIYPVNDLLVTRPGPRLVHGLYELLRAIHPELVEALPTANPGEPIGSPSPPGTVAP